MSNDIKEYSAYKTAEESPGYLLWKVSTQWRTALEKTLKQFDLTHPQFVVLASTAWLTKNDNNIAQIDVSRAVDLDPNTTSQILRGLEGKQLIKRVRFSNERSKNPHLTSLGFELLAQALPAVEQTDKLFFSSLDEKQTGELIAIFQKLVSP